MRVEVIAVPGIPEIGEGDDLGAVVYAALVAARIEVHPGDVLVLASKTASKALGLRRYASRDAVIAADTVRVVAERATGERVTRIVESVAGPVMAAAGVDESNVGSGGGVLSLPHDPDAAAGWVRDGVRSTLGWTEEPLGVILSDTAGRPWRGGVVDFALGSAGVRVVEDHRGGTDADGRPLSVTVIAVADEIAAAADLVKAKSGGLPLAIVRGLPWAEPHSDERGASSLVRTGPGDWFRLGPVEAVREALGIEPGSPASQAIGVRPVAADSREQRVERVRRLALHGRDDRSGSSGSSGVTGAVTEAGVTFSARDAYLLGRVVERAIVAAASEDLVATEQRLSPTSTALSLQEAHRGR